MKMWTWYLHNESSLIYIMAHVYYHIYETGQSADDNANRTGQANRCGYFENELAIWNLKNKNKFTEASTEIKVSYPSYG